MPVAHVYETLANEDVIKCPLKIHGASWVSAILSLSAQALSLVGLGPSSSSLMK